MLMGLDRKPYFSGEYSTVFYKMNRVYIKQYNMTTVVYRGLSDHGYGIVLGYLQRIMSHLLGYICYIYYRVHVIYIYIYIYILYYMCHTYYRVHMPSTRINMSYLLCHICHIK